MNWYVCYCGKLADRFSGYRCDSCKEYNTFLLSDEQLFEKRKKNAINKAFPKEKIMNKTRPGWNLKIPLDCGCKLQHRFVFRNSDTKRKNKTVIQRVYPVSQVERAENSFEETVGSKIFWSLIADPKCTEHYPELLVAKEQVNKFKTAGQHWAAQTMSEAVMSGLLEDSFTRMKRALYSINFTGSQAIELITLIINRIR